MEVLISCLTPDLTLIGVAFNVKDISKYYLGSFCVNESSGLVDESCDVVGLLDAINDRRIVRWNRIVGLDSLWGFNEEFELS